MFLPTSITGVHAKKQGEDLSDNDGDEDEGIFHGEKRWCMIFVFIFSKKPLFSDHLWFVFLFANGIIKHHVTMSHYNLYSVVFVQMLVCEWLWGS